MKISDVSVMFSMSPDTLRYYEKLGLLDNVQRTSGNVRTYDKKNIRRLQQIQELKKTGMSIHDIRQYLTSDSKVPRNNRVQLLKQQSILIQKELQQQFEYLKQTEAMLHMLNQENENCTPLHIPSLSPIGSHKSSDIL